MQGAVSCMNETNNSFQPRQDPKVNGRQWLKNPFVILVPSICVGVADLILAVRKHDRDDAVAVSLIFFVLVPVFVFARYLLRRWRRE